MDASKAGGEGKAGQPSQMKKSSTFSGQMSQAAIWKAPPGVVSSKQPMVTSMSTGRLQEMRPDNARLSPDSGRGSDPTGSDTSNFSDQEKMRSGSSQTSHQVTRPSHNLSGYTPPGWQVRSARFTSPSPDRGGDTVSYGYSGGRCQPPAYRPPPQPASVRNCSPASDPPPYRDPPPPPGSSPSRPPRPPHYSPPPQHRDVRGHKGASPGRSLASHNTRVSPSRGQSWLWPPRYASHSPHQVRTSSGLLDSILAETTFTLVSNILKFTVL